jgi:hypothetical protein
MSEVEKWVTTTEAFVAAAKDRAVKRVVVSGRLSNAPSIHLWPGQSLCGAAEDSTIAFSGDSDGIQLSSDNGVHNLHLETSPEKRALFNDTAVAALGRIELHGLTITGRVQILARDNVRAGHIEAPDCISGGVFVVYGAYADLVRNRGPVTTYGANDMVLDNWGMVDRWLAEQKITSYGPSGIGFVNFGTINVLHINAPIETFGEGARGFNVYSGTVSAAEFERIVTHGEGAVGIQISQPVGRIRVRRGVETYGSTGDSLVKGVVVKLSAIGLSVKPGGSARRIDVAGGLITHGEGVNPLELHGAIGSLRIADGFAVSGGGFEKI